MRPDLQGAVVTNYTALLDGTSWSGPGVTARPVFVTYSFEAAAQDYLLSEGFSQTYVDSFVAFNATDRQLAQNALSQWANATGLYFIEVPSGEGEIRFAKYNFNFDPEAAGFAGYAFYPWREVTQLSAFEGEIGGDVFINTLEVNDLQLMLHEIGHAIGLKHPFEGDPTLSSNLDNWSNTIMSYTSGGQSGSTLGPFDTQAAQYLYGGSTADGAHLSSWSWSPTPRVLTQTGTSGDDTILGIGQRDVIEGGGGSDILAGFKGNDRLSGGEGNDSLFGGPGDDILIGGAGNDVIDGGGDYWSTVDHGIDTVDYSSSAASIFADLGNWYFDEVWYNATGAAIGYDELYNVDNVIGSSFSDEILGVVGANVLDGRSGDDRLTGGGGDDTLRGGAGFDTVEYSVLSGAATWVQSSNGWTVTTEFGTDTLVSVERLIFSNTTIELPVVDIPASDLTGNGTSDILWIHTSGGSVGISSMDSGTATWGNHTYVNAGWSVVGTGDLNGDATSDILLYNAAANAVGMLEMGSGVSIWTGIGPISAGWSPAGIGDLDGNGTDDIIWHNSSFGALGMFEMDNGVPTWAGIGPISSGWSLAGTGDFNGDGTDDILWCNTSLGAVGMFEMDSGVPAWEGIGPISAGWSFAGTGDFDGDGTDDILWYNAMFSAVGMFEMHDGTATWAGLGAVDADWAIAATGDYNGDMTDDVLWVNERAGAIGMFEMHDGLPTWVGIGPISDGWQIV